MAKVLIKKKKKKKGKITMLDSYQRMKKSVTVTKKTHFQDSQDPDEFDITAAD